MRVGVGVVMMVLVGGCGSVLIVPADQAPGLQQLLEYIIGNPITYQSARAVLATAGFALLHVALIGQHILKKERIYDNLEEEYEEYQDYYDYDQKRRTYYGPAPLHLAPPAVSLQPTTSNHHHKRSVGQKSLEDDLETEAEELLVSAAVRLDRDGCVMKLLCLLDNKAVDDRTQEENILLQLFSNNPDTLSSYNAAFVAAKKDGHTLQQATCDQVFPRCPLREEELFGLLRRTWDAVDNLI